MSANKSPPLIRAVDANNIVECRRLIDTGEANINENSDWIGNTALHVASIENYLDIAELLTSLGAEVNIRNTYGWTALLSATYCDSLQVIRLLLLQGADVNMSIIDYHHAEERTVLGVASQYSCVDVIDCLRRWPWTMAIIALQEIDIYKYLDFSSFVDLWEYSM